MVTNKDIENATDNMDCDKSADEYGLSAEHFK